MVEVMQILGLYLRELIVPTLCLLGCLLLEPSHHAERKPRSHGEAIVGVPADRPF